MMEHGLPVISCGFEYRMRRFPDFMPKLDGFEIERLIDLHELPQALVDGRMRRRSLRSRLSEVAGTFIEELKRVTGRNSTFSFGF